MEHLKRASPPACNSAAASSSDSNDASTQNAAPEMSDSRLAAACAKQLGDSARAALLAPYMPHLIKLKVDAVVNQVWPRVQEHLVEGMCQHCSEPAPQTAPRREEGAPSSCSARGLVGAFRASYMPSDASAWKLLHDPLALVIFALMLHPMSQVVAFLGTFICIDRTDEFQLTAFVIRLKLFQLVCAGLYPAVLAVHASHSCMRSLLHADTYATAAPYCVESAPSSLPSFPLLFLAELVRVVLLWRCAYLLLSGSAFGGAGEIKALAYTRLDEAEEAEEGSAASSPAATPASTPRVGEPNGAKASPVLTPTWKGRGVGRDEISGASWIASSEVGAAKARGGALIGFIGYDALVLAIVCISTAALIDRDGDGLGSALFWSAVYNARTFYALLSFPFLVLAVPVLGPALVGAKPTGYDEAGRLVPRLTPTEARLKFDADQKRREERWAARLAKIGIHGTGKTFDPSSCAPFNPLSLISRRC